MKKILSSSPKVILLPLFFFLTLFLHTAFLHAQVMPMTPTVIPTATTPTTPASPADDNLPVCVLNHIGLNGTSGTINGCAADIAYGLYQATAWIAGLFGNLFDFFIGYSLSSASYSYPFVVTGWKLVRDISNIFFIIIMVWTGFSAVFNTSKTSIKNVIPALIINALLINFSLFATRVIIDISNITARMFYSEMLVCDQATITANGGTCPPALAKRGEGGYWPLSEKIVSSFNPQQMFKTSVLTPSTSTGIGNNTVTTNVVTTQQNGTITTTSERDYANYFGIVCLIAGAIMIAMAVMFFKVAFLFLGRVVGLYICMIFSPFAFLSRDMPMLGSVPRLKWNDWVKELTSYAMLAPVFIFFLYIIYTFLSSNFVQQIGVQALAASGFFQTVMSITIPMLIIYFFMQAAQKAAEGLSGDIGKAIQKFGEQATGFATGAVVGIASGGASLIGTSAAGVFKTSGETRARLEERKASGGISGQLAGMRLKASDWTQKQTFDARNTTGVQFLTKQFGATPNNVLVNKLGFGQDRTKGGREAQIKRSEEKTKKTINEIKTEISDDKVPAFWQRHIEKSAAKNYFKEQKRLAITPEARDALKKEKSDGSYKTNPKYLEKLSQEQATSEAAFGKVTNNKQLTQALRLQYAKTISGESTVGNSAGRDVASTVAIAAARTAVGAGTATVAMPAMALFAGAKPDDVGKRNEANDFIKGQERAMKKKPRADRLEEENKTMTKELEAIEKTLEKTYQLAVKQQVDRNPANTGKSEIEKQAIIDAEVTRLKNKENAVEAAAVITTYREGLRNTIDEIDLDVTRIDAEYKEAIKSGNTILAGAKEKQRYEAIARRNKARTEDSELDPKRKRELENNINRNEGEIEKIKTDETKKAEDKPKDDKK